MAFSFAKIFKPKQIADPSEILSAINYEGGTKFGSNSTNNVYIDVEELGGFSYLKTVIIGDTSVKIKRTGCTLTVIFKNDSITLSSDDTNITSNQIKKTKLFYTEIDFELDEIEATKIKKEKVQEIQYTFKNQTIVFPNLNA